MADCGVMLASCYSVSVEPSGCTSVTCQGTSFVDVASRLEFFCWLLKAFIRLGATTISTTIFITTNPSYAIRGCGRTRSGITFIIQKGQGCIFSPYFLLIPLHHS